MNASRTAGDQILPASALHSKPRPLLAAAALRQRCPLCGAVGYAQAGVHPKCAMEQADAMRMADLRRIRKPAVAKPPGG